MTANGTDDVASLRYVAGIDQQAGVLAYDDDRRMVIVTSRRTGRWVFPKGAIDPGLTPSQAAQQEAFEEAGLIGEPHSDPIGSYRTPKIRPPLIWTVEVELYPMRIEQTLETWLEASERQRRFVTIEEAADLLTEPEMLRLARKFWDQLQNSGSGTAT